jgi:hypothetical protein
MIWNLWSDKMEGTHDMKSMIRSNGVKHMIWNLWSDKMEWNTWYEIYDQIKSGTHKMEGNTWYEIWADKIEWNTYEIYEWIKLSGTHDMKSTIRYKVLRWKLWWYKWQLNHDILVKWKTKDVFLHIKMCSYTQRCVPTHKDVFLHRGNL